MSVNDRIEMVLKKVKVDMSKKRAADAFKSSASSSFYSLFLDYLQLAGVSQLVSRPRSFKRPAL
jgi:hypothetical protein